MANSKADKKDGQNVTATANNATAKAEGLTLAGIGASALTQAMPLIAGAYGTVFEQVKTKLADKFDADLFWSGAYTKNAKGQDTLDAIAKRQAVATLTGINPNTGRPLFKTDKLAARVFGWFSPIIRAGIRSMAEFEQAIERFGSAELVFRYAIDLGPVINFGRKVADAFKLNRKATVKVAIANFDVAKHGEFATLHSKVAVAQTADPTVDMSNFYEWSTVTLAARVESNKLATVKKLTAVA